MEKEKVLESVKNKGYSANLSNGILIFPFNPDTTNPEKYHKTIAGVLKEIGYNASWGIQADKKGIINMDSEEMEETPENESFVQEDTPSYNLRETENNENKKEVGENEADAVYVEEDSGQMSLFS